MIESFRRQGCVPYQRRVSATHAVENLALYCDADGKLAASFATVKQLLEISCSDRVVPMLEAIAHTITIERGSLETVQVKRFFGRFTQTMWEDTPTISLNEYLHAYTRRAKLMGEEFWKDTAIELLREDVEELKRRQLALERQAEGRQAAR